MPRTVLSLFLMSITLVSGCRSTSGARPAGTPATPPATQAAAPAQPAPAPAAVEPLEVRYVRNAAEYRAALLQAYGWATERVERAVASKPPGSWAVVLDADETVISNLEYQAERARAGLGFSKESWAAWVARRQATPLPGAAAFLAKVRSLGGKIAIVTNRLASECPATEDVFRANQLPYDVILCMPDAGPSDKNPRFEAVRTGTTPAGLPPLDVIAFLGDNINDFPGMSQAVKQRGPEAFADFGVRFFVMPNPMYGSWER